PFYRRLERGGLYPIIVLLSWAIFFLIGFTIVLLSGDGTVAAVRFGASLLVSSKPGRYSNRHGGMSLRLLKLSWRRCPP
ncbi:MAG: hypothetical protein WBW27_20900, partial [Pseudolabrys sp.]